MQASGHSSLTLMILLPLIGWRLYARFRRMVGRQRLSQVRAGLTLTLFPLLLTGLMVAALAHPARELLLVVCMAGGVALGVFGFGKTALEPGPQGQFFYTPNAHLGIALSLLFAGRVLYRVAETRWLAPEAHQSLGDFGRSPLTLAVFGLLAGYYISYAAQLLRWRRRVLAEQPEPSTPTT